MNPALANELAARVHEGWHPVTLDDIERRLRDIGEKAFKAPALKSEPAHAGEMLEWH